MSVQAVSKHLKVLERAGLIKRGREAQWRPSRLDPVPLNAASSMDHSNTASWPPIAWIGSSARSGSCKRRQKENREMGDTEIIIEPGRRTSCSSGTFDAPTDVVFRALTDPALIPSWWGPRKYETIVDEMEPRAGGRWRYINRNARLGRGVRLPRRLPRGDARPDCSDDRVRGLFRDLSGSRQRRSRSATAGP